MKRWEPTSLLKVLTLLFVLTTTIVPAKGGEPDALQISSNIRARHMPHGTILSPIFASAVSEEIVSYTRAADSAIWTGHYLAAETFRYGTTGSPEAYNNATQALSGIRSLVDITGRDILARCLIPTNSPYAQAIITEEAGHGNFIAALGGQTYYWIGNTSRDQYSGIFFGLGVAFDMIGNPEVRLLIRDLVTRLLDNLLRNNWSVVLPDRISTLFWLRPDQQLSFLQVGRRVNPGRFDSVYQSYRQSSASSVIGTISIDVLDDHNSYFKFNLNTINLYNLIRLEDNSYYRFWYVSAYDVMRRTTDDHGNAHFNMIDRGLKGPRSTRDAETRNLLEEWLRRPRRDFSVDWRGFFPACGEDRACAPIPVVDRVRTDFLWQRSPFLLFGGGGGFIEGPGIDYILPYWMARFYGVH
jgi:hypothetical protein